MKRLAALVVAVGLVLGAIQLRRVFGNDGGSGNVDEPPTSRSLICDSALEAACERLRGVDLTIERAGVTADRLAAGEALGADAWVVAEPWVEIASFGPPERPKLDATKPVAWSGVSAVVAEGSPAAGCEDWACLADAAVPTAHDSTDTTNGLAGIGALAGGRVKRVDFSNAELDDDLDFNQWLSRVENSANLANRAAPVIELIQTAGGFQVALGLEADARALGDRVGAITPKDGPTVGIVVAGDTDAVALDDLADALEAEGWRRRSGGSAFNPGALATLRGRVEDANR